MSDEVWRVMDRLTRQVACARLRSIEAYLHRKWPVDAMWVPNAFENISQHVIDIPGLDAHDQVSQVVVTIPNVPGKFMPAYNSVNQKQH